MTKFIVSRIFWTIPVILLVIFMTFVLMRQIGGNPFRKSERAVPAAIQRNLERKFNLDKPWYVQYALYVKGVATFDFGPSLVLRGRDVNDIVKSTSRRSIELGVYAFLFAIVFGVPLGVIAALRPNTGRRLRGDVLLERRLRHPELPDRDPAHLLLRAAVGSRLPDERLDDVAAARCCRRSRSASARWRSSPGSCAGRCSRRCSRTTSAPREAKGLRCRRVVGLHVLRNSLIPVVTAAGPLLGYLITGSFVIEQIFAIPGIGRYYVTAVTARDYSVVMGLTVLLSVIVILANLRRRHPLRHPRSADAGRAHLMVADPQRGDAPPLVSRAAAPVGPAGAPLRQSNLWRDAWRRYVRNKAAVLAGDRLPARPPLLLIWPSSPRTTRTRSTSRCRASRPSLEHPFGTDNFGRDLLTRTAARRPRLDRDRLRRHARDPADRRRLRRDLGLRRRPARQRDDALPRRPLRAAVPALRDHHARDLRQREPLDDGGRALGRELVHDRAHRPRPGHHPEGERLRPRGEGGGRALVPDPRPPPAAEHARRADHRDLPRAPGVILGEAFLSFIGLGISPPDASWGAMAQDGRDVYRTHPIAIIVPSIAIATLVLCANFIADGLRDALDPRTRET